MSTHLFPGLLQPQVQKEQKVNFSVITTFPLQISGPRAKSVQNLKIPEVKEAEILIGNNLGLRGNWVPFKFSYLEGVCVCVWTLR